MLTQTDKIDKPAPPELLSQDETNRLVLALLMPAGDRGVREDDIAAAFEKANGIRLANHVLDLALAGQIAVTFKNGDLCYSQAPPGYTQRFHDGMRKAARQREAREMFDSEARP
jgi:hypothetical protein